jgi:hypothetical protein
MAVVAGAIVAPTGLIASPVVLLLSNLKGEYITKKGQKITPLASWIGAGVVLAPLCWVANQTMLNNPSPPKETKAELLRIDFCRSNLDTLKPEDPLCGKYLSRLRQEAKDSQASEASTAQKAQEGDYRAIRYVCEEGIKKRLREPGSYQRIDSTFYGSPGQGQKKGVSIQYRARNGFGGMAVETVGCMTETGRLEDLKITGQVSQ